MVWKNLTDLLKACKSKGRTNFTLMHTGLKLNVQQAHMDG